MVCTPYSPSPNLSSSPTKSSLSLGTGKAARQRATVQGRIADGNLFPNISFHVNEHIIALIESTFRDARAKVDAVLDLIRADLDMLYGQEDSYEDGYLEFRNELVNEVGLFEERLEKLRRDIPTVY